MAKMKGRMTHNPMSNARGLVLSDPRRIEQKKQIPAEHFDKFKLDPTNAQMVEKTEDLFKTPPFMVIAQARCDIVFSKDKNTQEKLEAKRAYVMGLGMYESLRLDRNSGREMLRPFKFSFSDVWKRYNGYPLDGKTLLVWRTGGIGDLLFIKPNLDYLKETYPTCRLWLGCSKAYQPMVKEWECLDRVVDLPLDYYGAFCKADYHMTWEGAIERNKEAHEMNAYEMFSKWMMLDLPPEKLCPKQTPNAGLVEEARKVINGWGLKGDDFIVTQFKPSSPIRVVSPEKWVEIINAMTHRGYKVVMTDAASEADKVAEITNAVKDKHMVFNFSPHSPTIAHTIAMVSLARGVLAPDSAINHIGASLDKPVFGLFGPFLGEIRLKHFKKRDWIDATNPDADCAPCFVHSGEPCPQSIGGYGKCLLSLNAEEVATRADALFGGPNG